MATINIPFRRGTTAQNDTYKGIDGEITVDTDKRTIRVHDGLTTGGEELMRKSDLDAFIEGSSPYTLLADVQSKTVVYRGEAEPGSFENSPVWRICRITITYGAQITTVKHWVNGSQSFLNRWSDRLTYTYS
jgi:hypothetical protein